MTIWFHKKRFIVTTKKPNDKYRQILRPAFMTQLGSGPQMLKYGIPYEIF